MLQRSQKVNNKNHFEGFQSGLHHHMALAVFDHLCDHAAFHTIREETGAIAIGGGEPLARFSDILHRQRVQGHVQLKRIVRLHSNENLEVGNPNSGEREKLAILQRSIIEGNEKALQV